MSSCGDSQIDRQDTPEPSLSTFGASRTHTGLSEASSDGLEMDRYDFWKQLHTYRHTFSGAVRFEM